MKQVAKEVVQQVGLVKEQKIKMFRCERGDAIERNREGATFRLEALYRKRGE